MPIPLNRRTLLKASGYALGAGLINPPLISQSPTDPASTLHLSLNENPYGPSPRVAEAVQREFHRFYRYATVDAARQLAEQIAAKENVHPEQVILGEILGVLGLLLASEGGPGSEFLYSTPGYLALIDAAAHLGGVGVPVPLNGLHQNDLAALSAKINSRTRGIYLVNPHNPTGTVNELHAFEKFLHESSQQALVIVDEAYLEYITDFAARSAVAPLREGANVAVFRTFDKIHGLAGLPMGYVLAPRPLAEALRKQGAGDAEALGRLNLAAAAAALSDTQQVIRTRDTVAAERAKWLSLLDELKLEHTAAQASFVFFNARRPQPQFAQAMLAQGVDIGRPYPPYTNWARITIGLPEENLQAQAALRRVLR